MPSKRLIAIGVLVFTGIIVLWNTYFTVQQNKIAVISRFGKFQEIASPGLHFLIPFVQSYVEYPTDIQQQCSTDKTPDLINTYTQDNQEVDISWCVFYTLPLDKIQFIFEKNRDYQIKLNNLITDRLKVRFGQINVQNVADQRGQIRDGILNVVKKDSEALGILVSNFQLPNLEFGKTFRDAINLAAVQKANIERYEYEQQQEKKKAETAKIMADGLANAVKAKAEGDAAAIVLNANANAHRVEVAGKAEATAIQAQGDALAKNPNLIEWKKAGTGWDGKLPEYMLSGTLPLLNLDQKQPGKRLDNTQDK